MINNAGILRAGRFEDIDIAGQLNEIDINTKGVVNGLHAAFPYLRATPRAGRRQPRVRVGDLRPGRTRHYSATKFFVRGITEALDIEWSSYDIRVIAMWPLYVQTAMTENIKTGTTEVARHPPDRSGRRRRDRRGGRAVLLRRVVHQVHFPVGSQTKASVVLSRFSPAWLQRLLSKRLAGL